MPSGQLRATLIHLVQRCGRLTLLATQCSFNISHPVLDENRRRSQNPAIYKIGYIGEG
jgi:hypothetical protein